ncbi:MAG: hypothetical protein J6W67_02845 [Lentisphaeria bacterium]|nr:hypothetical protein [Lentisphaeria bacterium]
MSSQYSDPNMRVKKLKNDDLRYFSVDDCEHFVLEGLPFREKQGKFRRLPERDELFPYTEGVDLYATHSAGACLRFSTDSADIRIKAKVRMHFNSGDIMTLGRIGFDLYCGKPNESFCAGVTKINFDEVTFPDYEYSAQLYNRPNPKKVMHEFQVYFPLYAEVLEFSIGIEKDAVTAPPSPRSDDRPIILYGTSIEQGCSASRPGMCYAAIMSRKLNREVINMGFAGSGKGEPAMAEKLASINDPGAYILWYDSNVSPEELEKTLPKFTDILRFAHRKTPIITISKLPYPDEIAADAYDDAMFEERQQRTRIHHENMTRRVNAGDARIHFIDGRKLLSGDVADCFHDLIHPNDHGMGKIAELLVPRLAVLTQ